MAAQWRDREGKTDHRADTRAPGAGRIDDRPADDPVAGRADRGNAASLQLDPGHLGTFAELHAPLAGARDVTLEDRVRIRVTILRAERREADIVDAYLGEQRLGLARAEPGCRDAETVPQRQGPLEWRDIALLGDEEQVAHLMALRIDAHLVLERLEPG